MIRTVALMVALVAGAGPAAAVGLGPLSKQGVVAGSRKAFYLTIINPEPGTATFVASAIAPDTEAQAPRVTVFPSSVQLGAGQHRQLLVIAGDLQPGETFRFRVCAERAQDPQGATIHARVCSKLVARRLPVVAGVAGAVPRQP